MAAFIDLSIPITSRVVSDPPVMLPQNHYTTHETSWEQTAPFFPGLTREDLPDGARVHAQLLSDKIERASAGWIRAVALVDQDITTDAKPACSPAQAGASGSVAQR